ncbi:1,6-anhydro-N-acetylmuramyl-L-alanine amidase AmpD [Uliginosibacterium paludis]|uniref:1,6-anhydro-N-acetylmuramyl-L-alanine amidase AmpD n=1 Tax=Uliginosibacterium paludis TaxID=1615952 RepID=A0ABV2CK61_9RHOO
MSEAPISSDGWLSGVRRVLSPNCDDWPEHGGPELLVIHAISLPPDEFGGPGVEQLFTNTLDPAQHQYYASIAHLRVSAHFFIRRTGEIIQFVPLTRRAWHAGVSVWAGRERCNDFSLGIELEGCDTKPFDDEQYTSLSWLVATLAGQLPLTGMCGHSDIAPGRKTDPGPFFDWSRVPELTLSDAFPDAEA